MDLSFPMDEYLAVVIILKSMVKVANPLFWVLRLASSLSQYHGYTSQSECCQVQVFYSILNHFENTPVVNYEMAEKLHLDVLILKMAVQGSRYTMNITW